MHSICGLTDRRPVVIARPARPPRASPPPRPPPPPRPRPPVDGCTCRVSKFISASSSSSTVVPYFAGRSGETNFTLLSGPARSAVGNNSQKTQTTPTTGLPALTCLSPLDSRLPAYLGSQMRTAVIWRHRPSGISGATSFFDRHLICRTSLRVWEPRQSCDATWLKKTIPSA